MTQRHILLVDDEDAIRDVATLSLQAIGGWRVSSANGGREGIAKARCDCPDAILLDVMLPGGDGPATFQRLQADPRTRDIPVILLTANAQNANRCSSARLGVAGIVTKPFDPMTLSDQISAILASGDDLA